MCLGKLRAVNNERNMYVLYDNGEAYGSKNLRFDMANVRREYGAFMFRYEMCNVGNIRKMKVLMPLLDVVQEIPDTSQSQITCDPKNPPEFEIKEVRPQNDHETLLSMYSINVRTKKTGIPQDKATFPCGYRLFVDNSPSWNAKCNSYVYNFKGRVTEASIKNFQLVPHNTKKDDPTRKGR